MKKLFSFLLLLLPLTLWAQNTKSITGKIVDADSNESLIGVTVFIDAEDKEYKNFIPQGTITDYDGNFQLTVPTGLKYVIVSYLGYKTHRLDISEKNVFKVELTIESKMLGDVIVTGYQRIERRKLTSAVTKIEMDEVRQVGAPNIDQLLEGQVAGLVSTPTNGGPGAASKIRIRGTASLNGSADPLWVIDGVPLEGNEIPKEFSHKDNIDNLQNTSIAGLNPNDIADITILKDAAATAIYGARAANGVIVVTTKKGKQGKIKVDINAATFFSIKPNFDKLNLMNASEKVDFELTMASNPDYIYNANKGSVSRILKKYSQLDALRNGGFSNISEDAQKEINALRSSGVNWFDQMYRQTINQQYGLSVSGGSDKINYYFSAGYYNEQGTTKGTGFDRFNLTSNTDFKLSKKLTFSVGLFGNQSQKESYITDKGGFTNPANYTRMVNPYNNVYENGGYYYDPDITHGENVVLNFNAIEEAENTKYKLNESAFKSIFSLNYQIINDLKFYTQFGIQLEKRATEKFADMETYYTRAYRYNSRTGKDFLVPEGGIIQNWNNDFFQYYWKGQFEYKKIFNHVHDFDAMAGVELRRNKATEIHTKGFGFDPRTLTTVPLEFKNSSEKNNQAYQQYKKTFIENAYTSYYATASYTYDNRYTFFGSLRFDGSNLFGVDPKYRYLPLWSASGAWNINREEFLKDISWISNLKLRFSYGLQGNIDKETSKFIKGNWGNVEILPGTNEPSISVSAPPNQYLRWEKTTTYNGGLDFSVLNNRINLTLEGYYRNSDDLIGLRKLSQENGFDFTSMNWAQVTNKGFEISLSTLNIKNKNFSWRTDFNFSRNISRVEKYNIPNESFEPSLQGYPVNTIFALRTNGLDANGLPLIVNKEGKSVSMTEVFGLKQDEWGIPTSSITPAEYRDLFVYAGDNDPKFTGGFINKFTYKDFDLAISCSFTIGQTVRETPFYNPSELDPGVNYSKKAFDIFMPSNPNGKYPAPVSSAQSGDQYLANYWYLLGISNSYNMLDIWVKKNSYLRINSIRFGYSLPKDILKNKWVSAARFSFEARNPFVFGTNYDGYFAPETFGNIYSQPIARTFSIGINLSF